MYTNYGGWDCDITSVTMQLVCRLWAISFSYKDGGVTDDAKDSNDAANGPSNEDSKPTAPKLRPYWQRHKIEELPTPLEMLSFTFFIGAASIGVFFEYADFI